MAATTLAEREAVVAAATEARRRLRRRHLIASAIPVGALILLVVTAAVLAVGFNNSWWVQKDLRPSADQHAADGSSVFTQTGIDYFTRAGVVDVTMTPDRPTASELGLPPSGTKHLDFLVPLTLRAAGSSNVQFDLVDGIDIVTAGGRVSAIEITDQGVYRGLLGEVHGLASRVGWTDAQVMTFEEDLEASRLQHHAQAYTATIGPATKTGMPISAIMRADAQTDPNLVVRVGAEP